VLLAGLASAVDNNAAGLVTELVTTSLSHEPRFNVLASGDVRRQLELEANRAAIGCDEQASCLAEIAGALGAKLVVYGKLETLDDLVVLTLNLFDSSASQAAGRVAVRASSLKDLAEKVDGAVAELIKPTISLPRGDRRSSSSSSTSSHPERARPRRRRVRLRPCRRPIRRPRSSGAVSAASSAGAWASSWAAPSSTSRTTRTSRPRTQAPRSRR
jgi:hypothetical protein